MERDFDRCQLPQVFHLGMRRRQAIVAKRRPNRIVLLALSVAASGCAMLTRIAPDEPPGPLPATRDVLRLLQNHYIEVVDAARLYDSAVQSLGQLSNAAIQVAVQPDGMTMLGCRDHAVSLAPSPVNVPEIVDRFEVARPTIEPCVLAAHTDPELSYDHAVAERLLLAADADATLISPADYRDMKAPGFGGVGLELTRREGAIMVVAPLPGSPASRADIRSGDELVAIDSAPLDAVRLTRVVARLRGPIGTSVSLTLVRAGEIERRNVVLPREVIVLRVVESVLLPDQVGYIRIRQFDAKTANALEQALETLNADATSGLIIDLRGNSGGLLSAVVRSAGILLPKDALVVSVMARTQGSSTRAHSYRAIGSPKGIDGRLVLLVNHATAAGAEVVARALRYHRAARVIGEPTFGKGSVDTVYPIGEDAAVRFATGLMSDPQGLILDGHPLIPDEQLAAPILGTSIQEDPLVGRARQFIAEQRIQSNAPPT